MPPPDRSHPLARLWGHARGRRGRVLAASACSVLNKVFDLAPPLLIGAAVDVVVRRDRSRLAALGFEDPATQLTVLAAITVAIWVLESLFEYAQKLLWRNLAQTVQHELRVDAFGHVQRLELAFFEDEQTGQLMSILNDDVNQLERFLDGGANNLLQVATTVVVIGAIFFAASPSVAALAMLPMPFVVWGSVRYQRALVPRYARVREHAGRLGADLAGNLGGIATVKSYAAEDRETERLRASSEAYRAANRDAIALSSAFSPLIRMVIVVGFTATLLWGGRLALAGSLEVGLYSTLVFLTQRLLWPLTQLGDTFDLYQRAMASTRRLLGLLETPPGIVDGPERLAGADVQGEVAFEDVTFAYPGRAPALDGLDLRVPAGRTTAIVGATGAGKSTVVKLLLRFYDPQRGRVTLDGRDVAALRLADLRTRIGLVSQEVFLFHGTVRENIAFGRPEASDAEVVRAAQVAEADDFVRALPEGYDTLVGERGQKLSGGQRQRLSLARALLIDPPILVLDEATSAVDNETEAAIQRSLARVSIGRTTLVIAHRLSTVRHADAIHVLDAGRVAESGTHAELLARDGLYAQLWRVQSGDDLRHSR